MINYNREFIGLHCRIREWKMARIYVTDTHMQMGYCTFVQIFFKILYDDMNTMCDDFSSSIKEAFHSF